MTKEQPIRGDIVKEAFNELDVLGQPLKEAIIEHVERHAITLDDEHYCTLKEIENLLREVFGNDAASLLVERLRRGIDALKSFMIMAAPAAVLFSFTFTVSVSALL